VWQGRAGDRSPYADWSASGLIDLMAFAGRGSIIASNLAPPLAEPDPKTGLRPAPRPMVRLLG
jgi:hypothetical protein